MKKRQKKKLTKQTIIVYDIESVPSEIEMLKILEVAMKTSFVVWSSYNNGKEPKIYPAKNKKLFKIKDSNSKIKKSN